MDYMSILIIVCVVLAALLGIGFVFGRLYQRTTRDTAFVRTGLGGRKVVVDGGAVILPVFHSVAQVPLNTLRIEVKRDMKGSLITKDRLRADITVEFYVRVEPKEESIALAAQTLGDRMHKPENLKELVEAKFVDALRSVAARMTLTELQEKRADFVKGVQDVVSGDLKHNGLELESASLTRLDQTGIEHFNPDNSFDAEGLTVLKSITESRRQERNRIVREAEVAIADKDRESALRQLEITRATQEAQLDQARDIANRTAQTRAEQAKAEQEAQQNEAEARIAREQAVKLREAAAREAAETAAITTDLAIAKSRAESDRDRELLKQENAIQIAERSKAQSEALANAKDAEAKAVAAEEKVATARAVEIAEREREIQVIAARQEAERSATGITVKAEADRKAAEDQAKARTVLAEAEATAAASRAQAIREIGEAEAEAERLRNEARNALTQDARNLEVRLAQIAVLPEALRESMKPVEKIDSIRIFDAGNMMGAGPGAIGNGSTAGYARGSFGEGLADQLIRYQYGTPMIAAMLDDAGFAPGRNSIDRLMRAAGSSKPETAPVADAPTAA